MNEKQKCGEWELYDDEDENAWICPFCDRIQIIIDGSPLDNGWFFCPHCGKQLISQ